MIRTLTYRFSSMRKIWKANFALFLLLVLAIGMLPSYAGVNTKTSSAKAFASGDCGARIAVSLDRSSSIGVSEFGGSQANVDTIKRGVTLLNNSIIGPDSYTDYYTFASASRRVNTGGWFNLKDQTASNWQNQIVSGVKFKTGATNYSSGDLYDDGLAANSEGLTNWEGAITNILSSRQDPFPDAIIMFTDGEPTTNNAETRAAVAAGGTYTAAGIPNADGTDPDDLAAAYNAADAARAAGIRVIPVAIGDFSGDNYSHLVRLAGGGKVYTSRSLNDLGNLLKLAAADVCKTPTRLAFSAFEKTAPGTFVNRSIPITITGPAAGTVTTTGDPLNPWATKTFNTATDWDMRARAGIPAGYHPISERCERDKWDGKAPILAEAGDSVGVNGQILIQNQKPGGTTYCEFVYEKDSVTPLDKIELTKTVNPTSAKPGQEVVYSFVVKNTGNSVLKNVKITDPMLGGQVGATIASLAPGASSAVVTKKYTIPANATGTIHNVATATGTPTDPDGKTRPNVKDDDPADLTVLVSSWTATKTANKQTVVAGDTVTYTITVKNTGNTTLTNVEVSDPTINFAKVVIPEIKAGEFKSVTATYVIPKGFTGKEFKNVALVCVPSGTQTPDCKKPEALVKVINISIVKSADKETATPGDKVIYTFVVTNTGGADIDPTPINDNVLGVVGDPGVLEPGKSATFTKEYIVPGTAKAGDKIINIATVCASTDTKAQSVPTDCVSTCPASSLTTVCDQDTHTLTITIPKITIDKTADKESAAPGDSVIYTFVVTNTSDVDVFNVTVTDNILGDLGTIDKLAAGASYTKTVTYVVPVDAAGTIRNVATACFETPVVTDHCVSDDHVLAVVAVLGENVTRVSPSSSLAYTGASSSWMVLVGLLMLGAGVAIYFLTRKRRTI